MGKMRFISQPGLKEPHGNKVVWRYMSLDKFLDLLVHRRLFFVNAAKLTDQYEGTLPAKNLAQYQETLTNRGLSSDEVEAQSGYFAHQMTSMRSLTLVNSWSMEPSESYALWKIYVGGSRSGVAIRTTIAALKAAVEKGGDPCPEDVRLGQVAYTDSISTNDPRNIDPIMRKTPYYGYEHEVRLVISHVARSEGGSKPSYPLSEGRHVRVDLDQLIKGLYVSPFSAPWFETTLRAVIERFAPELGPRIVLSGVRDR